MSERKGIIKDRSFVFAVRIVKLYQCLVEAKGEFVLSKQLLQSGAAITTKHYHS